MHGEVARPSSLVSDLDSFQEAAVEAIAELCMHRADMIAGRGPATGFAPINEVYQSLNVEQWLTHGGMEPSDFLRFLKRFLQYSARLHHPHYIAHQVGGTSLPGALAATINGMINNPMAIYEMGPSAATLEFAVINWMLRKVGWVEQPFPGDSGARGNFSAGVLTHGGSLGNMTALLGARARTVPSAWKQGTPQDLAVLVPRVSHYSCARAIAILGLGERSIYDLPTSRYGVVDEHKLESVLSRVQADGRRPMALIANACSTATGLHDPLRPIGNFCQKHGIWFHIDACHGASALLAPHAKKYLDGIELADSIVWDAHKMLQVPALCAAVLMKDAKDLARSFEQDASYIAWEEDGESFSPMRRAVECTKSGLGLKLFLTLACHGETDLGQFVEDRYQDAIRFSEIISARSGFLVPYQPETNIICFRYQGSDALQQYIRDNLYRSHQFHITSTLVDGERYLRLTVMNESTQVSHINNLLDTIEVVAGTYQGDVLY